MSSFSDWSQTGLGQSLLATEQMALSKFLPSLKGDIAVQYGCAGTSCLLEKSNIEHKFFLVVSENPGPEILPSKSFGDLQALYVDANSTLPFLSSSVDLCLLPHMLDFSDNPHQLLRESKEILVSGGHLVILGFNPYSFWGMRKIVSRRNVPWDSHNYSVYKVRDWLSLLDFHVSGGMMLYYSPPIQNRRLREKFVFMENVGDRWWPMLGGVYLLIAQKREAGMTVIDLGANFRQSAFLNVAEPVAKRSVE
ncbi:MAG: class I SAM-dependent methyltransferase [Arenicellales bacterium]